jgi:2-dehydro-3-deoxyphosphogluconate aldolase/(4S)-4-hydroxy-2-oxoglutarate aldolase
MLTKNQILTKITNPGVIAVIRGKTAEHALNLAKACYQGGIKTIEITYTTPDATKVIKQLPELGDDILIGAGTVLDAKTAQNAIDAGAKFIVSPGFDLATCKLCFDKKLPYLPGCMTIQEMLRALKENVEIVKLFPGSHFTPSFIKAVKGPLPNIKIMPTGGVNLDNIDQWIKNGAVAVGIGSSLTKPDDPTEITKKAQQFIQKAIAARGGN